MYKALAYKELREAGWIGAIVFLAMMGVALDVMGVPLTPERISLIAAARGKGAYPQYKIPFVDPGLQFYLVLIAGAGAMAFGFRQVLAESFRSTWLFLLHRPMPRTQIFAVKIATGVFLLMFATAAPVLILAVWAAIPGTHASPFDWRMTQQPLRICFAASALYLAAVFAALREARWYGSRLVPLIPGVLCLLFIYLAPFWTIAGWLTVLVIDAALVVAILQIADEREYP